MSLSAKQKRFLVSGYLRRNSNIDCDDKFHHFVSEKCYSFYEETTHWHLSQEKLAQFFHRDNGESMRAPSIKYHDLEFAYFVFPNGTSRDDHGSIAIHLSLVCKPKDIDQISAICHIYLQNKMIFKECLHFGEQHRLHQFANSALCNLKLSEYKHLSALSFAVQIDIVNIHYHQATNDERFDQLKWCDYHNKYFQKVLVAQHAKYEWKLDEQILRQMKSSENKLFYFEDSLDKAAKQKQNESANWTISVQSNFADPLISLHLIKLPFNIKRMHVRCKLSVQYDDNEQHVVIMDVKDVGLCDNCTKRINYHHSERWLAMMPSLNSLLINWQISVLRAYDFNEKVIFRSDNELCFISELMNC